MKPTALFSTLLFLFLVGCSSTSETPDPITDAPDLAFAAGTPYGSKVIHLNLPARLTDLQIRQAILNAAYDENWEVVESGTLGQDGLVSIRRKTLFAETTFTFLFNPARIDGYSDSYSLDVTGKRTRRYTPPVRIQTIRDSIKENLTSEMAGY